MKTISIAMATYNGAKFIGEQLESLAKQTVLPDELIVCDDCSADNTVEIVSAFAASAPFKVRIEKNEKNLGWRANFMKAANLSKSDLISLCDQDDVWLPTKLEKCLKAFDKEKPLLVYHNATIVDENLKPASTLDSLAAPAYLNPLQTLDPMLNAFGFTVVFDRILLSMNDDWTRSIDPFTTGQKASHDQWIFFLASCFGSVVYLDEPLALYRRHSQSVTGKHHKYTHLFYKIKDAITMNVDFIRVRQRCAEYRSAVLLDAHNKIGYSYRQQAESAHYGYTFLALCCAKRSDMYKTYNPLNRLITIVWLIGAGGYRPRPQWGSGNLALIRDVFGIFFYPPRPVK